VEALKRKAVVKIGNQYRKRIASWVWKYSVWICGRQPTYAPTWRRACIKCWPRSAALQVASAICRWPGAVISYIRWRWVTNTFKNCKLKIFTSVVGLRTRLVLRTILRVLVSKISGLVSVLVSKSTGIGHKPILFWDFEYSKDMT